MSLLDLNEDVIKFLVTEGHFFWQPLFYTCKRLQQLVLQSVRESSLFSNKETFISFCALEGDLNLILWAIHYAGCSEYGGTAYWYAVTNGHLDVVKWLVQNNYDSCPHGYKSAISSGHVKVLRWLHEFGFNLPSFDEIYDNGLGNKEIEDWAGPKRKGEKYWKSEVMPMIRMVKTRQFVRLREKYSDHEIVSKLSTEINFILDGKLEDLEVLEWWESIGGKMPYDFSLFWGNAPIPIWEFLESRGIELSLDSAKAGIRHNNVDFLKWFRARGAPWDDQELFNEACSGYRTEILEYFKAEVGLFWQRDTAFLFPVLKSLLWGINNGCPLPENEEDFCAKFSERYRDKKILKWAIEERNFRMDERVALNLASSGDWINLPWAIEKKCPIPDIQEVYRNGVRSENLGMWKWIFEENGVEIEPYVEDLFAAAHNAVSIACFSWMNSKNVLEFDKRLLTCKDPRIRKLGKKLRKKFIFSRVGDAFK